MARQSVSERAYPDGDELSCPSREPAPSRASRRARAAPPVAEVVDADALRSAIKQGLAANLREHGAVAGAAAMLAPSLSRFAVAGNLTATMACLRGAVEARSRPALAAAPLLEAAAGRLRDDWTKDRITELDVSCALCILQTAVRGLCAGASAPRRAVQGAVLVATPPDEPHGLSAVLASEIMSEAGFDVLYRPTGKRNELVALVGSTWVDAVTLHASPALRRRERLGGLAKLIGRLRAASPNPALIVAAQGASFGEGDRGGRDAMAIGADAAFPSCVSLPAWLAERLAAVAVSQATARPHAALPPAPLPVSAEGPASMPRRRPL